MTAIINFHNCRAEVVKNDGTVVKLPNQNPVMAGIDNDVECKRKELEKEKEEQLKIF